MDFIKKFAKEISVFGLVIVVFLGLFIYRNITFKDYTTIKQDEFTSFIEEKKDFVVVLGDSTDNTMIGFQETMQKYTTNNRSTPLYYLDTNGNKKIDDYLKEKLDVEVSYPTTLVIKQGKLAGKKDGVVTYYSLYDFIEEAQK